MRMNPKRQNMHSKNARKSNWRQSGKHHYNFISPYKKRDLRTSVYHFVVWFANLSKWLLRLGSNQRPSD